MVHLPRQLRVAALLLAALAWMVCDALSEYHQLVVQHVVCPEHGELLELAQDGAQHGSGQHQVLPASGLSDHGHGCSLQGLPSPEGASAAPNVVQHPARITQAPLLAQALAPRGPPLAYAPKTSPPDARA